MQLHLKYRATSSVRGRGRLEMTSIGIYIVASSSVRLVLRDELQESVRNIGQHNHGLKPHVSTMTACSEHAKP